MKLRAYCARRNRGAQGLSGLCTRPCALRTSGLCTRPCALRASGRGSPSRAALAVAGPARRACRHTPAALRRPGVCYLCAAAWPALARLPSRLGPAAGRVVMAWPWCGWDGIIVCAGLGVICHCGSNSGSGGRWQGGLRPARWVGESSRRGRCTT